MRRGRRRDRSEPSIDKRAAEIGSSNGEQRRSSFFACYLLCSLSPRHKGCTYIGFTTNPRRRIRQHNGEMQSGAWRTKRKRPWEMILCIYGFPTNVSALQFEWAWQHPVESLAVREAAARFKSLSGIANKIKLAYTMLSLPSWENLNLMVNFFSSKYMKFTTTCPSLPKHMKVLIHAMDELPCYVDGQISDGKDSEDKKEDEEDNDINNSDGSRKASMDAPEMEMEGHGLSEWIEFDDFGQPTEPSYSLLSPTTESQKIHSSNSLEDTAEVFVSMEVTTPTTKIMKQFYDLVSPDAIVYRLSVPSNRTIDSCNKRVPEVIDLTDSPIYIPL